MEYSSVIINNKIGTIILNRPEANNTFNVLLATELNDVMLKSGNNIDINVVVINANGKNFCAGIDINNLEGKTNVEYLEWVELMERMNMAIAKFGATAVNVGLFCMGHAVPLLKSSGRKKTLKLILTGDIIDVAEAKRIGLVNKVVPIENLKEETIK